MKVKSLVQYKKSPAIVINIDNKIEIKLNNGKIKKVRDKDISLIHTGPINCLDVLQKKIESTKIPTDKITEAMELLENEPTNINDLSELIFDDNLPEQHWCLTELVQENTYFSGPLDSIISNDIEYANQKITEQKQKLLAKQVEQGFLDRIKQKKLLTEDFKKLTDIEELATKKRDKSNIFSKAGIKQTYQVAHQFLCETGYWPKYFNPYPQRSELSINDPQIDIPSFPIETRVDLTSLNSFAIDDAGNNDPDDAIAVDGNTIWVHIADVAALVNNDNDLEQQAQIQAANLYLPETTTHMLPRKITDILGLGLQEISPALSIGFELDDNCQPHNIQVCISNIKVKRVSYESVSNNKSDTQYSDLYSVYQNLNQQRFKNGAISLKFPEVKLTVNSDDTNNQQVQIHKLEPYDSKELVMEFMLIAGVAAAKFAQDNNIEFIYSTQPPHGIEDYTHPKTYAQMMAVRDQLSRSVPMDSPEPHSGLGLAMYSQVTSPLRRYIDLINHQQLRDFITTGSSQDNKTVNHKLNLALITFGKTRRVERESNNHWKCIYLQQNPNWQGQAHIVSLEERKVKIIIPELALETKIKLINGDNLDDIIYIKVASINLYDNQINFSRIKS